MELLRIRAVTPLDAFRLRLTLTNGAVVERDVSHVLVGPVFEPLRRGRARFLEVRAGGGTVAWPCGADLCPDVLIWGGSGPPVGEGPVEVPAEVTAAPTIPG